MYYTLVTSLLLMSAAERWAYGIGFVAHAIASIVLGVAHVIYRDRDRSKHKSRQKDVAGLSALINVFLAAVYGYLLFVKPGRWERQGDAVMVQWEPWAVYALVAPLLAGAIAFFNGAVPRWAWISTFSFFMVAFCLAVGDITSSAGPFVWFIVGFLAWGISVVIVFISKRRDSDKRYWFVWVWAIVAPTAHALAYLLGSAATGNIGFDLEVWIILLGNVALWLVFPMFLTFFYGGRVFRSAKADDAEELIPEDSVGGPDDTEEGAEPAPAPPPTTPAQQAVSSANTSVASDMNAARRRVITNARPAQK